MADLTLKDLQALLDQAGDVAARERALRELLLQMNTVNAELLEQLQQQAATMQQTARTLAEMQATNARIAESLGSLKLEVNMPEAPAAPPAAAPKDWETLQVSMPGPNQFAPPKVLTITKLK